MKKCKNCNKTFVNIKDYIILAKLNSWLYKKYKKLILKNIKNKVILFFNNLKIYKKENVK